MSDALKKEYESFLREDSGWHEASVDLAARVLSEFSDEDWSWLLESISNRPPYWQERCADAVGTLGDSKGVPVLIKILHCESLDVASIAATQLDDMEVKLPVSYKKKLQQLENFLETQEGSRIEDVRRLIGNIKEI